MAGIGDFQANVAVFSDECCWPYPATQSAWTTSLFKSGWALAGNLRPLKQRVDSAPLSGQFAAVSGSMICGISVIRVTGIPLSSACLRMASSLGER